MSSLSQRRPRAIEAIRRARLSERIARASCGRRLGREYLAASFEWRLVPRYLQHMAAARPLGADGVRELDQYLIRMDLNPGHMGVDEDRVRNLRRLIEVVSNRSNDQVLDFYCRDTTDGSGPFRLALEQGGGQIVAVLDAPFADVARGHAIAAVIEDPSSQQGFGPHSCSLMIAHLFGQLGLDCLEQVAVDDGRLLPGQDLALECHLAKVEPVAQQIGKRPAREWNAADGRSRFEGANLGDDALLTQVGHEPAEAAKPQIAGE